MDNEFKKKLIIVAVVFAAALIFYFIASPYQNCIRSGADEVRCAALTGW